MKKQNTNARPASAPVLTPAELQRITVHAAIRASLARMESGHYGHISIRPATVDDCPTLGIIAALATLKSIDCGDNGGNETIRALRYGLIAHIKRAPSAIGETIVDGVDIADTSAAAIMEKLADGYIQYVADTGDSIRAYNTPANTGDVYLARVRDACGDFQRVEKMRTAYGYGMKAARRYITEQDKRRGSKNIFSIEELQTVNKDGEIISEVVRVVDVRGEYDFQNIADYDAWNTIVDSLNLSERKREIVRLIRRGLSQIDIARTLGVHHSTVQEHIAGIADSYTAVYGNPYESKNMNRICAEHEPAENTTERRTTEEKYTNRLRERVALPPEKARVQYIAECDNEHFHATADGAFTGTRIFEHTLYNAVHGVECGEMVDVTEKALMIALKRMEVFAEHSHTSVNDSGICTAYSGLYPVSHK